MSECIAAKWTAASRSVGRPAAFEGRKWSDGRTEWDRFGLSRSTKRVTIAITSGKICDGSGEGFGPPRENGGLVISAKRPERNERGSPIERCEKR